MPHRGWKLTARIEDAALPGGRGAEVTPLMPDAARREKLAEGWEAQKFAIKSGVTWQTFFIRMLLD